VTFVAAICVLAVAFAAWARLATREERLRECRSSADQGTTATLEWQWIPPLWECVHGAGSP
jgi:hypothetical protein